MTQPLGPHGSHGHRPWVLCVDFGTTNTVAAVAEPNGRPRVLTVEGAHAVPSAVYLDDDGTPWGTWRVGRAAESSAALDPTRFAPTPKRHVLSGDIYLGGRAIAPHLAIAAVLHKVFSEAWRQHDGTAPSVLVLTHPARWRPDALSVLAQGSRAALADLAGHVEPVLLAEPVAAAWHASGSRLLDDRARVAVLDLGGGTCDVAIVDRTGDQFVLASAPLGIDPLGGEDFDSRLAQAVLDDLGQPALAARLLMPQTAADRLAYLDLRRSCRGAKEELSDQVRAHVRVPAVPDVLPAGTSVQVSRPHRLEPLLTSDGSDRPGLDSAADLVAEALRRAPRTAMPVSVFLVGGSSRIPLLGNLVHQRTGLRPLEHGDPGTAVAEGGAAVALAALDGRPVPTHPLPPAPAIAQPPPQEQQPQQQGPAARPIPEGDAAEVAPRTWPDTGREMQHGGRGDGSRGHGGPGGGRGSGQGQAAGSRKVVWWIVGSLLAIVLLCGGATLLSNAFGGSGDGRTNNQGDGGGGGDADGGQTEPGGTVSTPPSDDPPPQDPEVVCWDDSVEASTSDCPALEGVAGLTWVAGRYGTPAEPLTCEPFDATTGELEAARCDFDTGTLFISRWDSTDAAATYLASKYEDEFAGTLRDVDGNASTTTGSIWENCTDDATTGCWAWAYDDYPFTYEAFSSEGFATAEVLGQQVTARLVEEFEAQTPPS